MGDNEVGDCIYIGDYIQDGDYIEGEVIYQFDTEAGEEERGGDGEMETDNGVKEEGELDGLLMLEGVY
ncbi:MAG: hypothetical protein EZS28_000082 [Streblomastix strix]|uniref:Uncharacterized protein n=1 Tax=Streblomastix strix TaxID=222440 RepID=A0A5J4XCZ4_9EUKA|nr:MAG: hypothetical protein EZS28_000082 [Streblomastix strix]